MTESYDLNNVDELVAFDRDCCAAANECPQGKKYPITDYPGSKFSVACVFEKWFLSQILWRTGYSECLSEKAEATFARYAMFRDGHVYDSETGAIYDPEDTFQIATGYAKK